MYRAETVSDRSAAFATVALLNRNSGKQRKNSEGPAVLTFAEPSGGEDFRQERDAAG